MQRRASHRVPLVDGDADLLTNGECRAQDFLAAALRRRLSRALDCALEFGDRPHLAPSGHLGDEGSHPAAASTISAASAVAVAAAGVAQPPQRGKRLVEHARERRKSFNFDYDGLDDSDKLQKLSQDTPEYFELRLNFLTKNREKYPLETSGLSDDDLEAEWKYTLENGVTVGTAEIDSTVQSKNDALRAAREEKW